VNLRPAVAADLARHGITPEPGDTPATLREKLNERYLEDVRRLRQRQRAGEIPLPQYAGHVRALQQSYPLLALPLALWATDEDPAAS
jgi:hypothetical protein